MSNARMGRAKRDIRDARAAAGSGAMWSLGQSIIDPPPRRATDFLNRHILPWIAHYLRVVFTPRREFPSYDEAADKRGIFPMDPQCKIALVGDWGRGAVKLAPLRPHSGGERGTESAYHVMDQVRDVQKPDITIHLGDIYYSGQVDEVNEYFLGQDDWYRATRSFALNANHEMYSGGVGYFEHVLPALGQQASYFALE